MSQSWGLLEGQAGRSLEVHESAASERLHGVGRTVHERGRVFHTESTKYRNSSAVFCLRGRAATAVRIATTSALSFAAVASGGRAGRSRARRSARRRRNRSFAMFKASLYNHPDGESTPLTFDQLAQSRATASWAISSATPDRLRTGLKDPTSRGHSARHRGRRARRLWLGRRSVSSSYSTDEPGREVARASGNLSLADFSRERPRRLTWSGTPRACVLTPRIGSTHRGGDWSRGERGEGGAAGLEAHG